MSDSIVRALLFYFLSVNFVTFVHWSERRKLRHIYDEIEKRSGNTFRHVSYITHPIFTAICDSIKHNYKVTYGRLAFESRRNINHNIISANTLQHCNSDLSVYSRVVRYICAPKRFKSNIYIISNIQDLYVCDFFFLNKSIACAQKFLRDLALDIVSSQVHETPKFLVSCLPACLPLNIREDYSLPRRLFSAR